MSQISNFEELYKRFSKALKYITDHEKELKAEPKRWERIKTNFQQKFEAPLDLAWEALTKKEKESIASVYLYRKTLQNEVMQKVIKTFGGKVVKITNENGLSGGI